LQEKLAQDIELLFCGDCAAFVAFQYLRVNKVCPGILRYDVIGKFSQLKVLSLGLICCRNRLRLGNTATFTFEVNYLRGFIACFECRSKNSIAMQDEPFSNSFALRFQ